MVDVPVQSADLRFDVIESDMCSTIFPLVAVVFDFAGQFIDGLDVVCQCHGVSFKRAAKTTELREDS